MHAKDHSLNDVLKERQQWVIPVYQRNYAWDIKEGKQIPKLWEDLEERAEEYLATGEVKPHFVGAIIYSEPKNQHFGTVSQRFLVDGQQRISTFSLVLGAVKEIAHKYDCEEIVNSIKDYLFNAQTSSMRNPDREQYKLWSSSYDRGLYLELVNNGLEGARKQFPNNFYKNGNIIVGQAPKMLNAYHCLILNIEGFVDYQKANDVEPVIALNSILHGFLHGFQIVVVQLDQNDDAQAIFASLNGNAEPLSAFDLIRNDIFHRASKQGEDNDELFEKQWKVLETNYWKTEVKQGRLKRPRTDHLITHSLVAEMAKEISVGQVVNEYKQYSKFKSYSTIEEEIENLVAYSAVYQSLENYESDSPESEIGKFLNIWDMSAFHPLIFWIGVQDVSSEYKQELYDIIISYILRRDVCGYTNKNYNKLVPSLLKKLKASDDIKNKLLEELKSFKSDISIYPNDAEVKRSLLRLPIYLNLNSRKLRYIFQNIEINSRGKYDEAVSIMIDNLSVEHILPENWAKHWALPNGKKVSNTNYYEAIELGDNIDEETRKLMDVREEKKHTLGNLTIVTLIPV